MDGGGAVTCAARFETASSAAGQSMGAGGTQVCFGHTGVSFGGAGASAEHATNRRKTGENRFTAQYHQEYSRRLRDERSSKAFRRA